MTLTLLIDLDNTLLSNADETFLPAYFGALSKRLAPFVEEKRLISTLLTATQEMVANQRPDCTLKEVFDSHFYPRLGLTSADLAEEIDRFYAEDFPNLRSLTAPRPQAVQLVEEALRRGSRLVIATTPLFPRTAILQRLEWAGLPVEEYPFELITSYETFHFSKPNPAYLAECLARLGWPDGPVVVLGDSLKNDIFPAKALGLPYFQIQQSESNTELGLEGLAPVGGLEDFFTWIDRVQPSELEPDYSRAEGFLAILRTTPAVLDHLSRQISPGGWTARPQPNEWSLTEIICHLRDVDEEVNLPRLRKVLDENNPFIPGMVTDPWAEERGYNQQNGIAALGRLIGIRLKILDLLQKLSPEQWERSARHAIFGPTSLRELVSIHASHDRLHVQQALQVIRSLPSLH